MTFFNNDAWTPHCARNLEVHRARQCSSFFEANVGSSAVRTTASITRTRLNTVTLP